MSITEHQAPPVAPPAGHLIGGRIVPGAGTFDVVAPATEKVIAACPAGSPELVDAAMAAAVDAGPAWARDEAARREAIGAMADAIEAHREPLAALLATETGKPLDRAGFELMGAVAHARHWAAAEIPVDVLADDATQRVTLERFPAGVVAAIVPWNGPILMLVNKLSAAMLAGDTVVAKPSPFTPLTTLAVAELLRDVVPAGVVNVVAGDDDIGAAMVTHPATNVVSFTGSAEAGRAIMAAAAPGLKRLCLELGGNDAAIVLGDVAPADVVERLYRGAFAGAGQICAAIKRLYVHESAYEPILDGLAELARGARLGGPFEPGVTMGPITTRPQFDRVVGLVDDALAAGATAVTGGAPLDRPGYFYPPTLLTGVGAGVRVVDEEQFGPALPVIPFDDVEWAIAQANVTEYGLGGSVWTRDVERGAALARRLECGGVWVNRHPAVGPALPFGGCKQSGLGRENGAPGLDHLCELKTVVVDLT